MSGILRAIWNGPFHIGPLTQPTSVGDVLFKILETIWRAVVALLAAGLSLAGYLYFIDPIIFPPLKDSVVASIEYDDGTKNIPPPPAYIYDASDQDGDGVIPIPPTAPPKPFRCNQAFPIMVTLENHSSQTIGSISFSVEGHHESRSDNVLMFASWNEENPILPPDKMLRSCRTFETSDGSNLKDLIFDIQVLSAQSYPD